MVTVFVAWELAQAALPREFVGILSAQKAGELSPHLSRLEAHPSSQSSDPILSGLEWTDLTTGVCLAGFSALLRFVLASSIVTACLQVLWPSDLLTFDPLPSDLQLSDLQLFGAN